MSDGKDIDTEQGHPGLSHTVLERSFICGNNREQAKEIWGGLFDDKIWHEISTKSYYTKEGTPLFKPALPKLPESKTKDYMDLDRD